MEKRESIGGTAVTRCYATDTEGVTLVEWLDQVADADGRTETVADKGIVASRMTASLFRHLETKGIRTAFLEEISARELSFRAVHRYSFDLVVRNFSAGSFAERTGVAEGKALSRPTAELRNRKDGGQRYFLNGYDALALELVKEEDLRKMTQLAFRINEILISYFAERRLDLIDLSLAFGKNKEEVVLTGALSPDNMRLWDRDTHERLDADRFRRNLGNVREAYLEIYKRLGIGSLKPEELLGE